MLKKLSADDYTNIYMAFAKAAGLNPTPGPFKMDVRRVIVEERLFLPLDDDETIAERVKKAKKLGAKYKSRFSR